MCPPPALPMNLSINTSPARTAASAILSVPPARFFLLNHVRSQSLFNQRSSKEKTEISKKKKRNRKNAFKEIEAKEIEWLSRTGFEQQKRMRRRNACQSCPGIKGGDGLSPFTGITSSSKWSNCQSATLLKCINKIHKESWFHLPHSKHEY